MYTRTFNGIVSAIWGFFFFKGVSSKSQWFLNWVPMVFQWILHLKKIGFQWSFNWKKNPRRPSPQSKVLFFLKHLTEIIAGVFLWWSFTRCVCVFVSIRNPSWQTPQDILRDRPFNLTGRRGRGVMVFCFIQNFFFGQHKS